MACWICLKLVVCFGFSLFYRAVDWEPLHSHQCHRSLCYGAIKIKLIKNLKVKHENDLGIICLHADGKCVLPLLLKSRHTQCEGTRGPRIRFQNSGTSFQCFPCNTVWLFLYSIHLLIWAHSAVCFVLEPADRTWSVENRINTVCLYNSSLRLQILHSEDIKENYY